MDGTTEKARRWGVALVLALVACTGLWGPAARAAETTTYVLTDVQGTVLAREDVHGNIIARYDYRPYGKQQTGPVAAGPGYTGHVEDPDTGLVYMQQRYYDPEVGRFLSIDPIAPLPGSTFNFNRFAYANNNPVRYTDPDGRCPWCIGAVVGAVSGAVLGGVTAYVASGGNLRQTFAGAVGGGVGGLITGGSLGSGASIGSTVAIGITAGLAGETATETTQNIVEHGADLKSYQYSPGKIAVSGALGMVGTANAKVAEVAAEGLSVVKKAIIAQSVVTPVQLVSDQVTDHPENIFNDSVNQQGEKSERQNKAPENSRLKQDYLRIQ